LGALEISELLKRVLIIAVATMIAASRASAADLPVRPGPGPAYYPVVRAYDWGGGYIGINGGYGFGQSEWSDPLNPSTITSTGNFNVNGGLVGATAGVVPPVPGYFRRIREICDRHGILLILDEVMCGMGRTGTLHACTAEGVVPDLLILAKGLGAGYQPIGAVLVQKRIYDAFVQGSGFFQHGHTFMAHPMACAASLAVQKCLIEDKLLDRVTPLGDLLQTSLYERFGNHPHVGNIRGRGLFQAIELVKDRATKAPFDPALALHARVKREAFARQLLVYPMGGTIDGRLGDHVLLAPPFIASEQEIREIVSRLGEAVVAALAA